MLARLFVAIGGLIVLALTVALVGPYFIDWTNYRADFEREASAILGRTVTVKGEASARLLPFPSVTFTDVAVAGGPAGAPSMTIETFSMDAELAPFLRGEFLIFDMRLVRPKGTIAIADDGVVDWAVRPSAPFDAGHISLERLTVTEGQIAIRHAASGRSHLISEINTDVSAKSLAGPWRVAGTMRLDGMLTEVSLSTGTVDENGSMRLRVRADPEIYPLEVEADGSIKLEKGAAVYAGQFKVLPTVDDATKKVMQASGDPGYRLNGQFKADHRRLSVEEFLFETGPLDNPYSADGTGFVDFGAEPRFAITADGAQVRFDEAIGAAEPAGGLTLEQRLEALERTLSDMPRPTMPGTVDVNLPAIVAGDTTIREVHVSAEPARNGWTVKSFAATLPGRAKLEASGDLVLDGTFGFAGSMLLAVGQPSGFAAWLSRDVDDAIRRLPAAGFQAKVSLTRERQVFSDLELGLGDATFRGEAESYQPANARPSAKLTLEGGALDVDGLAAFASLFFNDMGASRFADRDFDLAVKAGPVSVAGMTAETVDTALRLREGAVEVDRLAIGGLAGANVSATGSIRGLPEQPSGKLDLSVIGEDLADLAAAAANRFRENRLLQQVNARIAAYPGLLDDGRIDIVASAAGKDDGDTDITLDAKGEVGGTTLTVALSGKGRADALAKAEFTLKATGRNDDATALLAWYGLPVLPLGLVGAGEAELSLKGTAADGMQAEARLAGGDFVSSFSGTATLGASGLTAKGKASIQAADIEPWLMTAGAGLPGMGMGSSVGLDADVDYADGLLVIGGLEGAVNEGAVAGDINVGTKNERLNLTGQLTLDELDLAPFAAMVLGDASLEGGGETWSVVPFSQAATIPFSVEVDIAAATLAAGPSLTAYDSSLSLRLDESGLRVADLKAKLFDGQVSGLFELKNNEGNGLFSGQMKLAGTDLQAALGQAAGIDGSGDFTTALSASGKSVGGLVAALSGSGTAVLKNLSIDGINPQALPQFIARADAIGRDVDAAKVEAFAPGIAAAGKFTSERAETAFSVAGGVMRSPPTLLNNADATMEASFQADLNSGAASADGTITYKAGDEALVGSEPVLRFAFASTPEGVTRTFDSAPLAQFLTQRALEIEQARVEAMQAALLEKQRLRREVRYYAALQDERARLAEEARLKAEAEERARLAAEEAARLAAEAKAAAEAEAARQAEEAVRLAAEEKARKAAERAARPPAEIQRAPLPEARPSVQPFSMEDFLSLPQ